MLMERIERELREGAEMERDPTGDDRVCVGCSHTRMYTLCGVSILDQQSTKPLSQNRYQKNLLEAAGICICHSYKA
jgi:hypothetical protein